MCQKQAEIGSNKQTVKKNSTTIALGPSFDKNVPNEATWPGRACVDVPFCSKCEIITQ